MSGRHSRYPAVNRDVPPSGGRHLDGDGSDPETTPAPEPEPAPEPVAAPEPEVTDEDEATAGDPDAGDPSDGYPEDGSIATVLEWVGEDEGRADFALAAENAKEHPRKGILDALGD